MDDKFKKDKFKKIITLESGLKVELKSSFLQTKSDSVRSIWLDDHWNIEYWSSVNYPIIELTMFLPVEAVEDALEIMKNFDVIYNDIHNTGEPLKILNGN